MRKVIIPPASQASAASGEPWLDLEALASVEVTSEDAAFPIEAALLPGREGGWRAATAGEQTVRLVFDLPQCLRKIHLLFVEDTFSRTQEFVLRWSSSLGEAPRDIVRQQYTFAPPDTVRESEEYQVELASVAVLELVIIPDIRQGSGCALLTEWRLA